MSDKDFCLTLRFNAPAAKLYQQFATEQGVRNWWTEFCTMEERVGGQAAFRFPSAGFHAVVRIAELKPHQLVEWECLESEHPDNSGFVDLHDWVGTRMRFEIEPKGAGQSQLAFTHVGLIPLECKEACSSLWSFYLGQSLRGYLETGSGKPHTKDA